MSYYYRAHYQVQVPVQVGMNEFNVTDNVLLPIGTIVLLSSNGSTGLLQLCGDSSGKGDFVRSGINWIETSYRKFCFMVIGEYYYHQIDYTDNRYYDYTNWYNLNYKYTPSSMPYSPFYQVYISDGT